MEQKYVIPSSVGGLSGRLRCIINAIFLSEKTNRKIILYWEKNSACNSSFINLFDETFEEISKENLRGILKKNNFQILKDIKKVKKNKKFIIIGDIGLLGENQKFKISDNQKKDILRILKRIKIIKSIKKEAENFIKKNFSEEVIGIHIRKGDFKFIKNNVGHVSSDEKFIEEIKKEAELNKKVKFFLATEEKETEEKFKKIFGSKLFVYPKKTTFREQEGSVKEALIELLILSRCKKILGSFGSTFTEFAWLFGECNPEIKIIIDNKELRIYENREKAKEGYLSKIKKVIYELITPAHIRLLDKI